MRRLPPDLSARLAGYRWQVVEAGESGGAVHRLTAAGRPTLYLKHGAGRVADDITDEMARLAWLAGRASVPAIVGFVRDEGEAWLATEGVGGESVDALIEAGADAAALVGPVAAFLRALHALPVDECPFDAGADVRMAAARANMAAGRVDTQDFGEEHRGWSAERVWERLGALRPAAMGRAVTHGDFSLGNVLVGDGRVTGCIDVGRAGVADPYGDLAICWQNWEDAGAGLGDRFLSAYGITAPDRERIAFHLCLDEFF